MGTKAKIISINSGNKGVGKTCTAVNLAVLLAQQGHKVCLFDADAKLENVNIMLGLITNYTLQDVLTGDSTLQEITLQTEGFDVIPGMTGLTSFMTLSKEQKVRLQNTMLSLQAKYEYLIIDNTASISDSVRYFTKISNYIIIVITPDPDSLSAAFSLIRILEKRNIQKKYQILVNNVSDESYALNIFKRFFTPIEKHIGCQINYLGCIISDDKLTASVCMQNPVVLEYPDSPAAFSFKQLARKFISISNNVKEQHVLQPEHKIVSNHQINNEINNLEIENNNKPLTEQDTQEIVLPEQVKDKATGILDIQQLDDHKLKELVVDINNAYTERFGHYAIDLTHVIKDALKMDYLSEKTLRNLLMTLHSLYQDKYGQTTEAKISVSSNQLKTTNLTQESINQLIKLLQQESISNMQAGLEQTKTTNNSAPIEFNAEQIVNMPDDNAPKLNDLLESIRYASMVDNLH